MLFGMILHFSRCQLEEKKKAGIMPEESWCLLATVTNPNLSNSVFFYAIDRSFVFNRKRLFSFVLGAAMPPYHCAPILGASFCSAKREFTGARGLNENCGLWLHTDQLHPEQERYRVIVAADCEIKGHVS